MTVSFINPVADCLVPIQPYNLNADLTGDTTIGLVINKIVDCDRFMTCIGEVLADTRPNLTIKSYETGKITYADGELIDQIANECDAAICAIGHCGSCTAGTVKDGIALVKKGTPAVSLVTSLFWEQAASLARSLGWPDSPRVQLPYPIWGIQDGLMQDAAKKAVSEIVPLLEDRDAQAA